MKFVRLIAQLPKSPKKKKIVCSCKKRGLIVIALNSDVDFPPHQKEQQY